MQRLANPERQRPGVVEFRRYGAGGGTGRLRIWHSRMLTGGIDNTWNRLESGEGGMEVGPYPSAQGARWGPEGRKIRVISYMGAAMASFLYGFLFIYNGWGW